MLRRLNDQMARRAGTAALVGLVCLSAACAPAAQTAPTSAPAQPPPTTAAARQAATPAATAVPSRPTLGSEAKPAAKEAEEFFKGKTMRILVGQAAGGGFDAFARLLARHMAKHIPGTPTIIVENQGGAGGLIAFNTAYNTDPKDGTALVMSVGSLLAQQLFGNSAVAFDATKFNWLGAQTRDVPACAVRTDSGFGRLEDAMGSRELVLGGTAPGSTIDDVPNMMKNLLGVKIRLVSGYAGGSAIKLATDAGEVMGACITWQAFKVTWQESLSSGAVKVIAQGSRQPHPDIPDVPLIRDLARTDEQRQLVDATMSLSEYTRVFALPPGVPAERVKLLRDAFSQTLTDKDFLAEAEKAKLDVDVVHGEELERVVKELFSLSPDLVAKLKAALTPA